MIMSTLNENLTEGGKPAAKSTAAPDTLAVEPKAKTTHDVITTTTTVNAGKCEDLLLGEVVVT